jgi:hypothetical protein
MGLFISNASFIYPRKVCLCDRRLFYPDSILYLRVEAKPSNGSFRVFLSWGWFAV